MDGVRVMLIIGPTEPARPVVALHRAAHLARKHRDARILLTTFSVPLANALHTKLRLLLTNEPRLGERIEVYSMDAIGRRLYELNIGKLKIATKTQIAELLRQSSKDAGEHKFSLRFLTTEWEQVVDGWQLDSWEEYRDVNRLGRKTRLREEQRKLLWTIFEAVRAGLHERELITTAGMLNISLAAMPRERHHPSILLWWTKRRISASRRCAFLPAWLAESRMACSLRGILDSVFSSSPSHGSLLVQTCADVPRR